MPSPIALLSTDFDGTLHSDFERPPIPLSLQSLIGSLQSQGVRWLINTGRDLDGTLEGLARAHVFIKPDFLGVVEREIYRRDGLRYFPVNHWNDACKSDHDAAFDRLRADLPKLQQWIEDHCSATVYQDPWSPLCVIAEAQDAAMQIVAYLESYCKEHPELAVMHNDVYARFCHASYHKGTVLSEVARLLSLSPEHILAAGDHYNDLPMLDAQRARMLVAPSNAMPEVKAHILRQNGFASTLPWGHGIEEGIRHFLGKY